MTKAERRDLKTRLAEARAAVQKARTQQRVRTAALNHPKVKGQPLEAVLRAEYPNWRAAQRAALQPVMVPVLQQVAAALSLEQRLTSRDAVLARATFTPAPKPQQTTRTFSQSFAHRKANNGRTAAVTSPSPECSTTSTNTTCAERRSIRTIC